MKKMFLILIGLIIICASCLADGVGFIKVNSDDENSTSQPVTMPGSLKLLEFDPVSKNVTKIPDIQAEMQKQKELDEQEQEQKKEEEKESPKLQQMKFDGFTR